VSLGFFYFNFRLTIEWVAVLLFTAALLYGRGVQFLRDWSVFVVVLLAWQFTSPLATDFGFPWHLQELIAADKLLFAGKVPALWLQQHLYHPGVLEPWDVLAAIVYMSHFLMPLVCGFLLWLADRDIYRKFAISFVLLAFAGFLTYILYPSVPPHMASQPLKHVNHVYVLAAGGYVYLPGVRNLFQVTLAHWFSPYHGYVSLTWKGLNLLNLRYDPVAEIPSEHAAFPLLFFLYLRHQFGRPAYLVLPYIAAILFAVLYLGMHWFIDVVIGFIYAAAAYGVVMHAAPAAVTWIRRSQIFKAPHGTKPAEEA
jgi:membrane-associated phospholipid phosphatase